MKSMFGMVALAAAAVLAQAPQPQAAGPGAPQMHDFVITAADGIYLSPDNKVVAFVHEMSAGPVVKNAPFSAEAVTETIQQLYDGNRIVQRQSQKLYRDSQGRERREQSAPMEIVSINDPVAGESYTLHPDTRMAEKRDYAAGRISFNVGAGAAGRGVVRFSVSAGEPAPQVLFFNAGVKEQVPEPRQESLGTRIIEGVQAEGTRSTTTIPAGAIGNERPIEIVDERWFSPDLHMTVMTRHADPRSGETVYRLTNIQRVEQVRSLFEIPTGYAINDLAQKLRVTKPLEKLKADR
jgi:hypothetical protein